MLDVQPRMWAVTAFVSMVMSSISCGCGGDSDLIRQRLGTISSIERVRIVDIGDFESFLVAVVEPKQSPRVAFYGISHSWFDSPEKLTISHVGDWAIACRDEDGYFVHAVNVRSGSGSPLSGLNLQSVSDVVRSSGELEAWAKQLPHAQQEAVSQDARCYSYRSSPEDRYFRD